MIMARITLIRDMPNQSWTWAKITTEKRVCNTWNIDKGFRATVDRIIRIPVQLKKP